MTSDLPTYPEELDDFTPAPPLDYATCTPVKAAIAAAAGMVRGPADWDYVVEAVHYIPDNAPRIVVIVGGAKFVLTYEQAAKELAGFLPLAANDDDRTGLTKEIVGALTAELALMPLPE